MSITAALANANSGLSAVSRAAEIVASNVANSQTEGYGRREIELGSASVGGRGSGVRIIGVTRTVNEAAISDRRLADADLGFYQEQASFLSTIETSFGTPDQPSSLSARLAEFEADLVAAESDPSSIGRLSAVVNAAISVTDKLNAISDQVGTARERADQEISNQVDLINQGLQDVARLNTEIQTQIAKTGSAPGLMDQRQAVIDQLTPLIPLIEIPRDKGAVALSTPNGTVLVDYRAASLEFSPKRPITAEMTLAGGALSGITIIDAASTSGEPLDAIAGGALAANFAIRDELAPQIQSQLDAFARNLIDRGSDVTVDPTRAAGSAGVFTDAGSVFDPLDEPGLAGRISLNALLNPAEGGAVWRIRDGLGAGVPGPASDNALISRLSEAFGRVETPTSGTFLSGGDIGNLASDVLSQIGLDRQGAETRQSFAVTQISALQDVELTAGVDTDEELQKLLLIEQAFAANARVIQTVDELIQTLLGI